MILVNGVIELEFPYVRSIKERRNMLRSIKERLGRYNLSILDLSGSYAKEGEIAFAFLAHDRSQAARILESMECLLSRRAGEYEYRIDYETL